MSDELNELNSSMANMFQMMMGAQMAAHDGIGGSNLSECAEGNWRSHPTGALFRAVKELDCDSLLVLLQQEEFIDHVDDGDGVSIYRSWWIWFMICILL